MSYGNLLFIAGIGAHFEGDIKAHTKHVLDEIQKRLESVGSSMEKVVNLCKRRGFVYPGSEIYGGLGSSLDYGPLGVELKRNVKDAWWQAVITGRDDRRGRRDSGKFVG